MFGRLFALENTIDIGRRAPEIVGPVNAVEQQATGFSEEAEWIHRRETIASRQRCDLDAMGIRKAVRHHDEATIRLACLCGNDGFQLSAGIASTEKEGAAALRGASQYSAYGADTGWNNIATRATRGATPLSSSSHLPAIVGSVKMKPVTLPPGRAKLATKPLPIGSATIAKTIGMVRVCCSSTLVGGVVLERMTLGCSATISFATDRIASTSAGVAQRVSIWALRPSVHPSLRRVSRKAAYQARASGSLSP